MRDFECLHSKCVLVYCYGDSKDVFLSDKECRGYRPHYSLEIYFLIKIDSETIPRYNATLYHL